jgi:hypothetical protein
VRYRRAVSLLTVWVFFASAALAAAPPPATQVSPAVLPVTETSGERHALYRTRSIVVNWRFKNAPGSANLVVNPDGTYLFSGSYKQKVLGEFDILLGLKSSLGAVYLFHYEGNASNGVLWSKPGTSTVLKDDFKTFTKLDWSGGYRFHLTAEGRKELEQQERECASQAKKWGLPDSWTGGQTGHCNWYELVGRRSAPFVLGSRA